MKPISNSSQGGHSAEVKMRLLLRGRSFGVVQLGADFLFLDVATDQAPGEGSLVLRVDRSVRRWRVRLPDGISAGSKRVTITTAACPGSLASVARWRGRAMPYRPTK